MAAMAPAPSPAAAADGAAGLRRAAGPGRVRARVGLHLPALCAGVVVGALVAGLLWSQLRGYSGKRLAPSVDPALRLRRRLEFRPLETALRRAIAAALAQEETLAAAVQAANLRRRELLETRHVAARNDTRPLGAGRPAARGGWRAAVDASAKARFPERMAKRLHLLQGRLWEGARCPQALRRSERNGTEEAHGDSEKGEGTSLLWRNRCSERRWLTATCSDRRRDGGRMAPQGVWKRDPFRYPENVKVSMLLQYFRQPDLMEKIVTRLYDCTCGSLGEGSVSGLTTELVVNVDEPSTAAKWKKLWQETRPGKFLVLVFSHNVNEVRGYNRAAQVAKGDLLVLLQDDEEPPASCMWMPRLQSVLHAWPNVGLIGMRGSSFAVDNNRPFMAWIGRMSDRRDNMPLFDSVTNVRMHFATVVDSSPTIYRKRVYFELGGQDEGIMGKKGESGIFCDWDMAMRMWLAGYQVAHMFSEGLFFEAKALGGTYAGKQQYIRARNSQLNGPWLQEEDRIFREVQRVNLFLLPVDPWL